MASFGLLEGVNICVLTSAHPVDDVRVMSKLVAGFLEANASVSWIGPHQGTLGQDPQLDKRIEYRFTHANLRRWDRMTAPRRIARIAPTLGRVDWYYCPDVDAAAVATRLARQNGARVLFDIHEMYHEALLKRWTLGRDVRLAQRAMKTRVTRIAQRCDLVVGVNHAVLDAYSNSAQDRLVVRSCAPIWFAQSAMPRSEVLEQADSSTNVTRFMHGKVTSSNGTDIVVQALAILANRDIRDVAVEFIAPAGAQLDGEGRPKVAAIDTYLGPHIANVRAAVPHREMPRLLQQCDVGMIAYGRELGADSLPNRIFEYMAAGLAVLVPIYSKHMTSIVDTEKIGCAVDFESPTEVADAMKWFSDHREEARAMGARARRAFLRKYNWSTEFAQLAARMRSIADAAAS